MSRCLLWFMLMSALSAMINLAAAAEIYRWRDAQGKWHYGERIPQNADYEQVDASSLPPLHIVPVPEKPAAPAAQSKTLQQQKSRVQFRQQPHQKSRFGAKENPQLKYCRRYQEQLETIQAKLRAGYREPQGNRLRAKRRQLEQRQRDEC